MAGRRLLVRGRPWSQSRRIVSDIHRPVQPRRPSFCEKDVLHMDNHVLFVNKPPGLLSQGDRTGDVDVVALAREYIRVAANKPGEAFVATVHRLDRPVSGVMCIARTSKAAARLSASFRARDGVEKWYHAVVAGRLSGSGTREDVLVSPAASRSSKAAEKNGRGPRTVVLPGHGRPDEHSSRRRNGCECDDYVSASAALVPIGSEARPPAPPHDGDDNGDAAAQASPPASHLPNSAAVGHGKRAVLQWEAIDLSRASSATATATTTAPVLRCPRTGDPRTLVRIKLVTGRKHQIRVQLAQMGHPVVGDVRYGRCRRGELGTGSVPSLPTTTLPFDMHPLEDRSILLHASELAVPHPTRPEETVRVRASPPRAWADLCGRDVIEEVFGERGTGRSADVP